MDGGGREWENVVDNSDNEDLVSSLAEIAEIEDAEIGDGFTFPCGNRGNRGRGNRGRVLISMDKAGMLEKIGDGFSFNIQS
jgi:hypothetical protein